MQSASNSRGGAEPHSQNSLSSWCLYCRCYPKVPASGAGWILRPAYPSVDLLSLPPLVPRDPLPGTLWVKGRRLGGGWPPLYLPSLPRYREGGAGGGRETLLHAGARELGDAHEVLIYPVRRFSALGDGPDNQALAPARVACGKDGRDIHRHVVLVGFYVAARV